MNHSCVQRASAADETPCKGVSEIVALRRKKSEFKKKTKKGPNKKSRRDAVELFGHEEEKEEYLHAELRMLPPLQSELPSGEPLKKRNVSM